MLFIFWNNASFVSSFNVVRELTLNVNHTLFDLGSGPVQEVSEQ